ncbi:hypothetical protein I6F35_07605 [Bradyrhizobium sp. BRP22]|uniref:hypothetical protein n=1 Tax=Bradyrhizobium sp. BRP22 TaxID=2793821 RepID=UPI001CD5495A|nr:hypothetical protein [Bradyrhizobium sp. BRP22]MCA1453086.1 hypothetical protein [Bradyrhizobium sp. BRP22]
MVDPLGKSFAVLSVSYLRIASREGVRTWTLQDIQAPLDVLKRAPDDLLVHRSVRAVDRFSVFIHVPPLAEKEQVVCHADDEPIA